MRVAHQTCIHLFGLIFVHRDVFSLIAFRARMAFSPLLSPCFKRANYLLASLANSWQKDQFFSARFSLFIANNGFKPYPGTYFCGEKRTIQHVIVKADRVLPLLAEPQPRHRRTGWAGRQWCKHWRSPRLRPLSVRTHAPTQI